jgi:hypothetical protein
LFIRKTASRAAAVGQREQTFLLAQQSFELLGGQGWGE